MLNIYIRTFYTVPRNLPIYQFTGHFSSGDFVDISIAKPRNAALGTIVTKADKNIEESDEDESSSKLFACPVDGCIKLYQLHSSLENHLHYGKCKLTPERDSLFDKAKLIYRDKLLHGTSVQPVLASSTMEATTKESLPQGWALKSTRTAMRFNDQQKAYLNEMFAIGTETGHKIDSATVARDMRYAKDKNGSRRFVIGEFLTPAQVQSYFSRRASKLKNSKDETPEDTDAAEDQAAYSLTRDTIIKDCQLVHPIVFDSFNICNLYASNSFKKLGLPLLRTICDHFDLDVSSVSTRRKAPYIELISNLVKTCSCVD